MEKVTHRIELNEEDFQKLLTADRVLFENGTNGIVLYIEHDTARMMPVTIQNEVVESCPYCDAENTYINYDAKERGYKTTCYECGKEIMLCSECLHAEDNPNGMCDWREEYDGVNNYGICFRGITDNNMNL